MEEVLDLYAKPPDPDEPLIAMDESSVQLLRHVHEPLPMRPAVLESDGTTLCSGTPRRVDDQYERNGTRALFMFFAPHQGWRRVTSSEHRTKQDWAEQIKRLLDEDFPAARRVHLVCDNLNIHSDSSLYETFTPEEAHRLKQRLVIHFTPKHGSWLNIAEIELSVLARQCLDRRLGKACELDRQLDKWTAARNQDRCGLNWHFTTADARIRLQHLYPPV
jgi:hypothetical protein